MARINLTFNRKQNADAGMALVLIFLLIGLFTGNLIWLKVSIPAILIVMIFPSLYYPFSVVWYNLSNLLGSITSRIVLGSIYFLLVCPVGLARRMAGKDVLQLKKFKSGRASVFTGRDMVCTKDEIKNPY